ncbi:unnamed protein product [Lampetra fluviatilis]
MRAGGPVVERMAHSQNVAGSNPGWGVTQPIMPPADLRALCRAAGLVSSTVTAVVHSIVAGFPVHFSIPQSDGCRSDIACQLAVGQGYSYNARVRPSRAATPTSSLW